MEVEVFRFPGREAMTHRLILALVLCGLLLLSASGLLCVPGVVADGREMRAIVLTAEVVK